MQHQQTLLYDNITHRNTPTRFDEDLQIKWPAHYNHIATLF